MDYVVWVFTELGAENKLLPVQKKEKKSYQRKVDYYIEADRNSVQVDQIDQGKL